jgi:hypothetical protein
VLDLDERQLAILSSRKLTVAYPPISVIPNYEFTA